MALQKKLHILDELDGDIVVLQECSKKSIEFLNVASPGCAIWIGKNLHKGLGVIVRQPLKITQFEDLGLTWAAKVKITGSIDLEVFAVWACASEQYDNRYIRQVHLLIDRIENTRPATNSVLIGDLNSNSIWDNKYRGRGHSSAVQRLGELGLTSAYHAFCNEAQGSEKSPTLFLRKQRKMPYHIDYVFLSESLAKSMRSVTVGSHDDWIRHSDHMPLIVELAYTLASKLKLHL